jgi:hypothetical protein
MNRRQAGLCVLALAGDDLLHDGNALAPGLVPCAMRAHDAGAIAGQGMHRQIGLRPARGRRLRERLKPGAEIRGHGPMPALGGELGSRAFTARLPCGSVAGAVATA